MDSRGWGVRSARARGACRRQRQAAAAGESKPELMQGPQRSTRAHLFAALKPAQRVVDEALHRRPTRLLCRQSRVWAVAGHFRAAGAKEMAIIRGERASRLKSSAATAAAHASRSFAPPWVACLGMVAVLFTAYQLSCKHGSAPVRYGAWL